MSFNANAGLRESLDIEANKQIQLLHFMYELNIYGVCCVWWTT